MKIAEIEDEVLCFDTFRESALSNALFQSFGTIKFDYLIEKHTE